MIRVLYWVGAGAAVVLAALGGYALFQPSVLSSGPTPAPTPIIAQSAAPTPAATPVAAASPAPTQSAAAAQPSPAPSVAATLVLA